MEKVVCNSSPIIHLAKLDLLELLHDYYSSVSVPESVYNECISGGNERPEVNKIRNAKWIKVLKANDRNLVRLLENDLDQGESEAIAVALEIRADLIVLDDADAREKARIYGLPITGVLGIIMRASFDGKISSFKETLSHLKNTGFWISEQIEKEIRNSINDNKIN